MADFCKACSDKLFGPGMPPDLGGITKEPEWLQGLAVSVICEGCGPIQVDPEGNCVSQDCLCAGEPGHGLPWHLDPKKIDFCGTPTGRLQTTEPQPIVPRTKHQLATMPRLGDFDASALEKRVEALLGKDSEAGTQSIHIDATPLSQEDIKSIGMAMVARGGEMMFSSGRSERDSLRSVASVTMPFKLAEGEFQGAVEGSVQIHGAGFPVPGMEFPVQGRPLAELDLEKEHIFERVEVGTAPHSYDVYRTDAWPGEFRIVSVGGPGVRMDISVGYLEPPVYVKTITELLKQSISGVERSAGEEAWAEFKRFHGNAVVYEPVRKELEVTAECLQIVYSFMRTYHPGVEVEGLTPGWNGYGPVVKVFGKLKEEADPNARIDLKGD